MAEGQEGQNYNDLLTSDTFVKSMSALSSRMTLALSIGQKQKFDGLNGDQFSKWVSAVDLIHMEVDRDDKQTLWAASQLLGGSALDFYQSVASTLESWEHLKRLMKSRYHYLDDSDTAKQKLLTFTQRSNESIPQYAERLQSLARQAHSYKLE